MKRTISKLVSLIVILNIILSILVPMHVNAFEFSGDISSLDISGSTLKDYTVPTDTSIMRQQYDAYKDDKAMMQLIVVYMEIQKYLNGRTDLVDKWYDNWDSVPGIDLPTTFNPIHYLYDKNGSSYTAKQASRENVLGFYHMDLGLSSDAIKSFVFSSGKTDELDQIDEKTGNSTKFSEYYSDFADNLAMYEYWMVLNGYASSGDQIGGVKLNKTLKDVINNDGIYNIITRDKNSVGEEYRRIPPILYRAIIDQFKSANPDAASQIDQDTKNVGGPLGEVKERSIFEKLFFDFVLKGLSYFSRLMSLAVETVIFNDWFDPLYLIIDKNTGELMENAPGPGGTVTNSYVRWFNIFRDIGALLIPLLAIIAAYKMMLSIFNPDLRTAGKEALMYTLLFITILLTSHYVLAFLLEINNGLVGIFHDIFRNQVESTTVHGATAADYAAGIGKLLGQALIMPGWTAFMFIVTMVAYIIAAGYLLIVLFFRKVMIGFLFALLPLGGILMYFRPFRQVLPKITREIIKQIFLTSIYAGSYVIVYDLINYMFVFKGDWGSFIWELLGVSSLMQIGNTLGPVPRLLALFIMFKMAKMIKGLLDLEPSLGPTGEGILGGIAGGAKQISAHFAKVETLKGGPGGGSGSGSGGGMPEKAGLPGKLNNAMKGFTSLTSGVKHKAQSGWGKFKKLTRLDKGVDKLRNSKRLNALKNSKAGKFAKFLHGSPGKDFRRLGGMTNAMKLGAALGTGFIEGKFGSGSIFDDLNDSYTNYLSYLNAKGKISGRNVSGGQEGVGLPGKDKDGLPEDAFVGCAKLPDKFDENSAVSSNLPSALTEALNKEGFDPSKHQLVETENGKYAMLGGPKVKFFDKDGKEIDGTQKDLAGNLKMHKMFRDDAGNKEWKTDNKSVTWGQREVNLFKDYNPEGKTIEVSVEAKHQGNIEAMISRSGLNPNDIAEVNACMTSEGVAYIARGKENTDLGVIGYGSVDAAVAEHLKNGSMLVTTFKRVPGGSGDGSSAGLRNEGGWVKLTGDSATVNAVNAFTKVSTLYSNTDANFKGIRVNTTAEALASIKENGQLSTEELYNNYYSFIDDPANQVLVESKTTTGTTYLVKDLTQPNRYTIVGYGTSVQPEEIGYTVHCMTSEGFKNSGVTGKYEQLKGPDREKALNALQHTLKIIDVSTIPEEVVDLSVNSFRNIDISSITHGDTIGAIANRTQTIYVKVLENGDFQWLGGTAGNTVFSGQLGDSDDFKIMSFRVSGQGNNIRMIANHGFQDLTVHDFNSMNTAAYSNPEKVFADLKKQRDELLTKILKNKEDIKQQVIQLEAEMNELYKKEIENYIDGLKENEIRFEAEINRINSMTEEISQYVTNPMSENAYNEMRKRHKVSSIISDDEVSENELKSLSEEARRRIQGQITRHKEKLQNDLKKLQRELTEMAHKELNTAIDEMAFSELAAKESEIADEISKIEARYWEIENSITKHLNKEKKNNVLE